MKKILLSLAALVSFGTISTSAEAAGASWDTSPQCKIILSLPPVSYYVRDVLKRADDGIDLAIAAPVDPAFKLMEWTNTVRSAFAGLIDSNLRLSVQADDLIHNTACLRFDTAAIECKMDQIRLQMNAQLQRGSFEAIQRLESILLFLNDRLAHLHAGALDPSYSDPTWKKLTPFDPPGTTPALEMCPYDSDYAPPQQNGFGCDIETLETRTAFLPLKEEHDALKIITTQLDDYRRAAQQFLTVQQSIDELFQTPSTLPPPPAPRTHLLANGCGWTGGLCEFDSDIRCNNDNECDVGDRCVFPTKICENNRTMSCLDDLSCMKPDGTSVGPCIEQDGKKPAATELRGPFSLQKKHMELLIDFLAQRMQEGNSRVFKDSLKTPEEFSDSQSSLRDERRNDIFVSVMIRSSTRLLFRAWSLIQGREEATIFPSVTDPQLQVAKALTPLRTSVKDLANLTKLESGQKDSLRGFVVKFASFLRRSCIYRPCTNSLDEVLKIVFTDDCFPYTNGDFLSDTASNPRSKKCADKAKITIP